ncbi:bifunctional diguanylate cyclase/phosphodiesterase [Paenibacillus sp. HB172176]|uniref:putative bifunctional diguanylate cyclase/phosphodiesterase n=1 Tax=Paenibacillus sp. HB172176 TaxID=2493690 RepID=UPI00143C8140|nr:bifunctional diguanylate cyclase/phosphodiesterase [Paenibacillus sp. HB172176]
MTAPIDLPGRREAYSQLELAIAEARLAGKRLLIALADIDQFCYVNETWGWEVGNQALLEVERRLHLLGQQLGAEGGYRCFRYGGNSFIVLMMDRHDGALNWHAVEAIKFALEKPIAAGEAELFLSSSVGVCLYPKDGYTSEQLMCRAEFALFQSKSEGGAKARFYSGEDTKSMNRRLFLTAELRTAFLHRQLELSYQPIYEMASGKLKGFEALVRWQHSEFGPVSPHEFIPIAEHCGLIIPLGEWVLREACHTLSSMNKYGLLDLTMSVNISHLQLADLSFPKTLLTIIREAGLRPQAIELEFSESNLLGDRASFQAAISRLRAEGVRIVLDDFGGEGSSFQHLLHLPVHGLKLCGSYTQHIAKQTAEHHVAEGIISMARKLGLEVIAKGVEQDEQYLQLKEWGCNYVQGYLLGKPTASMEEIEASSAMKADLVEELQT